MDDRDGLIWATETLRGMTAAGESDYTIGSTEYWQDYHLTAALDRHRVDVVRELLTPVQEYEGGTVIYKRYRSQHRNFEATTGGSAVFTLRDATGNLVAIADYTPDYALGEVTFAANTGGSSYYLTGRSYNLNAAAADVWRMKSAHFAGQFTFSTDNMRVEKGALMANAQRMAQYYDSMGGAAQITVYRSDTDG